MSISSSLRPTLHRGLALAVFAGAGLAVAGAQTAAPNSADSSLFQNTSSSIQPAALPAYSSSLANSQDTAASQYDPATAALTQLASLEKSFTPPGANMQYGQRRRYGAPRYRGGNTNPDGSEKYTVYAGAGFTVPVSGTSNYLSPSYGIQVGGGRNFNKNFGVNLEFDYDRFGLTNSAITNFLYVNTGTTDNSQYGLGGNNHIWNFSIQPIYNIYSGPGLGAYITAGVGFYHKVTNFTLPQEEEYCDIYYGCGYYEVNGNIDHYTSNAPGFDGGIGLTYKFSRFSNERLYGEMRYVYIDNQYRPGTTTYNTSYTGSNFFPANSNTTSYFPVKFGIRF